MFSHPKGLLAHKTHIQDKKASIFVLHWKQKNQKVVPCADSQISPFWNKVQKIHGFECPLLIAATFQQLFTKLQNKSRINPRNAPVVLKSKRNKNKK